MYIGRFDNNNILIIYKPSSGMGVCKEGSRIRHRTTDPLAYFCTTEPTREWNPGDTKYNVNGYAPKYHFKISDLKGQITDHDREEGLMMYKRFGVICETTFNMESTAVSWLKDRLRNGGCFLSKAMQTLPASGLFGLNFDSLLLGEQPASRYSN